MRMVDLIEKKRNGNYLAKEEIDFIIRGFVAEAIPDYQVSALLMAIFFQGMNSQEIADLTMSMVHSGDIIDLSSISGIKVDKHSTGGVGDKTSLIVGPLVASVGVPVAKMSGRGLGHTGGTIDKLESIEGFNVELTNEQFINNVNSIKIAIVGQTGNLAPADKKLYALRDVTATVNSIPLIASSIMSKKIASGADAIVLDVKAGSGAFMKSLDDAKKLARTMVQIGNIVNKKTIAIITDMNQPLGYEIGNANEVREAIEVLNGKGEENLTKVCLTIASYMAISGGIYSDFNTAYGELEQVLQTGKAIEVFKRFIEAQGGDSEVVNFPERLPHAKYHIEVKSDLQGYVQSVNAEMIGTAAMLLGAGRKTKHDNIDYSAGISIKKKVGEHISREDTIAVLHTNHKLIQDAEEILKKAFIVGNNQGYKKPIIYDVIE